jgi:arylsulfatase A-like enzyme
VTYAKPIIQLDILPTVLTAAGGTINSDWKLDGVDLMPFLTGKNDGKPHETLYWRFGEQWAIRKGDWKLVASRIDKNVPRLINLASDIGEAKDLAADEPEKLKSLPTHGNRGTRSRSSRCGNNRSTRLRGDAPAARPHQHRRRTSVCAARRRME